MVYVKLDKTVKRPAITLVCNSGSISCLIDTGALMSVWCFPLFLLKSRFPDVEKTNYCTTISGFGGVSSIKRDVWRIPEFVIQDSTGDEKYVVKNMLVAVADDIQITSFNLILSSLIFHGSSYQIFDRADDRHLEIYPGNNRPAVCVPGEIIDKASLDTKIGESLDLKGEEILINGITVFFDEEGR